VLVLEERDTGGRSRELGMKRDGVIAYSRHENAEEHCFGHNQA